MKNKCNKLLIILFLMIIFAATATFTLGKYAYNNAWNYYLSSKGFYFESDLLNINTKKNSILKWDGSDINFQIKNSQNDKTISEYDISYRITCEILGEEASYINCSLNGTSEAIFEGTLVTTAKCINEIDDKDVANLSKAECEVGGYTWNEQSSSKNNYFNLELTDPTKSIGEVSVKVVAESITPYHQALTGIFNLNRVDSADLELVTSYQEYSEYDEISITNTTDKEKCIYVSFDTNKHLIDQESATVSKYETDESGNINKIELILNKNSSLIYKFYKIFNNENYSINDFEIGEKEC